MCVVAISIYLSFLCEVISDKLIAALPAIIEVNIK